MGNSASMEGIRERRARLSDLPDDVLTRIYKYVRWVDNDDEVRYYLLASHHWPAVSKKFRAISCKPELWNIVRLDNPRPKMYRWLTVREAGLKELSVYLNECDTDGSHNSAQLAAQMLAGLVSVLLVHPFKQLESLLLSYSEGEQENYYFNQPFPLVCELTQLRSLRVGNFCVPMTAEDIRQISQLQRLTALSLETNLGTQYRDAAQAGFNAGLATLTGLQSLTLNTSCFRFPDTASLLSNLSRLVFSEDEEGETKAVKLPASISDLTRLAWLEIGSLDGSIHQLESISSLRYLCLGLHRTNLLSDNEGFGSRISALHCDCLNCIKTALQGEEELLSLLPARVKSLKYAAFENLDHCRPMMVDWRQPFPDVLFQRLPNLRILSLVNNGLHELPPGLTALLHLEVLGLCHNHLPEVPQLLRAITTLTHLDMSFNPELQINKEGAQVVLALPKLRLLSLSKMLEYSTPTGSNVPLPVERWNVNSVHWLTVLAKDGVPLSLMGRYNDFAKRVEVKAIDKQGRRSYQVLFITR